MSHEFVMVKRGNHIEQSSHVLHVSHVARACVMSPYRHVAISACRHIGMSPCLLPFNSLASLLTCLV